MEWQIIFSKWNYSVEIVKWDSFQMPHFVIICRLICLIHSQQGSEKVEAKQALRRIKVTKIFKHTENKCGYSKNATYTVLQQKYSHRINFFWITAKCKTGIIWCTVISDRVQICLTQNTFKTNHTVMTKILQAAPVLYRYAIKAFTYNLFIYKIKVQFHHYYNECINALHN